MTGAQNGPMDGAPDSWQQIRREALERDAFTCVDCGLTATSAELDVHHRIPRADGGPDELANLVTLCDGCHGRRHPNLQVALSRRFIEAWAVRLARILDVRGDLPKDMPNLGPALRVLGKEALRDGQLRPVLAALRGESVLVVRPTGSGKSLCFQLPTLLTPGTAFVLSPLKALMSQHASELQRLKIPATFLNGDLGPEEKSLRYGLLERNFLKFFFCTPERFDPEMVRLEEVSRVTAFRPNFLVVDEAHCVDRWGKDFRPNYGRLADVRQRLGAPPVLAFTATAGPAARQVILESIPCS